jgi:hypothetical protein
MSKLADRLEDIPGVASVSVDLTEDGGGINIRLSPEADETQVLERLREVLVAYGVRTARPEPATAGLRDPLAAAGVRMSITPLERGARIEAESRSVRSFRIVGASPDAIAQGVADVWCRVVGRRPPTVVGVDMSEGGHLVIKVVDGDTEATGTADVSQGWEQALKLAVGRALGLLDAVAEPVGDTPADPTNL